MKKHDVNLPGAARDLKLQIAIDGPAGAGKSTVGQSLAHALDCAFVDTGLMYRAVTELALREKIPLTDSHSLAAISKSIDFQLSTGEHAVLLIGGEPGRAELRAPEIDSNVSQVSAHPEVRRIMLQRQRDLTGGRCVVMVGRDIGTVVLPAADAKLWVIASPQERARRRASEYLMEGETKADEMVKGIARRDAYDAQRADSPLQQASDAIVIDTEELEPAAALDVALDAIRAAIDRSFSANTRSSCEATRSS